MTPESKQLEAQSREAIIAHLTDPSVQLEFCDKSILSWMLKDHVSFHTGTLYYRIAKPRKWYRVAKMQVGTSTVNSEQDELVIESSDFFIEWLDKRKYYD